MIKYFVFVQKNKPPREKKRSGLTILPIGVAKTFFQGKTNTGEMLRVTGFTYVFQILGVIPVVGGLVGAILSIIGNIIGVREAAEFDTTKAILTSIIAGVIAFIIVAIIVGGLTAVLIGAAAITGGGS